MRYIMIAIMLLSLVLLTGCWDRYEPEKLAIVLAGGFDYNPETNMYQVIFQIANQLTMKGGSSGGSGGGSNKPNFWTVSAWGHSLYDALANISKKVSRKIAFSHVQLYIMSERMARIKGVLPVINAIARSRQSRLIVTPIISKQNPQKILAANLPLETSNAMGLVNQIKLTMEEMAGTTEINARVFLNYLTRPGQEPYAAAIEYLEDKKEEGRKSQPNPGEKPEIKVAGKFAFIKDKVVGFLDDRETRGCNWIVGKVKAGTLVLKYPDDEDNLVDVIATEGSSKIIPIIKDDKPAIKVIIKASGRITNMTGISGIKETSKTTKSLNNRMAQIIRNDIKMSLEKCQNLKSDIFGFGNAFYRLKYNEWKKMESNWGDIFATIPVEIEVEANIKTMGMVNTGPEIH